MGSICSSINDDENDWYDFRKENRILNTTNWKLYSQEYLIALDVKRQHPVLSGTYLEQYVEQLLLLNNILESARKQNDKYLTYLSLKEEFEK